MSQLFAALKAQPDAPPVKVDASEVDRRYRYWRVRILATSMVGYAIYYFVRTNISLALKPMQAELGYSKAQLGVILTLGGVTYGVSKFVNGFLGDRANPRYFMAIGLLASAVMNVFFGLSSAIAFFAVFWLMNNWAQGMGFPPCARNMAYWFSPRERSSTFGIWHISHMLGAALVSVLTAYLVKHLGWRSCFFVPAGMAVFTSLLILIFLRDTPGSMGLPPVEVWKGEETPAQLAAELREAPPAGADGKRVPGYETPPPGPGPERVLDYRPAPQAASYLSVVIENIFKNPYMWVISVANLLVYTLRYTSLHWGPSYLQETKGFSVVASGWLQFGSEMAGLVSALVGGFVADYLFRGRAGRVCVIAMAAMAGAVYAFWVTPREWKGVASGLFIVMGFMVYVPQMLIAAMAMNLGTKRAAAAAVGLTGIFGYASTIVSGWGVGRIVDKGGWDGAFVLMIGCAVATMALMAVTWNVGAHPHLEKQAAESPAEQAPEPVALTAK